ncbi:probable molybdenum cofactor biosynthesis protein A [Methanocella paludicola SANAE]|uniref:Probable GTP 3',8-cyclase n=1 Tax=Methanocella paludicola (strain DSM 17711 / JCM 13418 / NBRC 101707 / SANAE) TaxID=304371 RepID=D1YWA3_METPS|nr:GTP 3',8-cyclase MoaA [Methanocella paludicola]BAI60725.1 probable molybdenum cofactor biosynthesis protein A [Methanocella paludicola SANAE]
MQESLVDNYGRRVTSLRMSLTNRCNLQCIYCHNEGESGSGGEITVDEIARLVRIATKYGVDRVKFSGGEPLLRTDLEDILRALPPLKDISLTTNGTLLAPRAKGLKEAGLDRVNISLDTMDSGRFDLITQRKGQFSRVMDGINAAIDAGLTPVKLNMVYLKGINEDEIERMIEFIRGRPLVLQVIELMNFKGAFKYHADISALEHSLKARADDYKCREMHRRTKYYLNGAEVEIVRPIDNSEFCMNCNRLRVTSDFKLKPCLLRNDNLVSLRGLDDEGLEKALRYTVGIREPFFKAAPVAMPKKSEKVPSEN